VDEKQKDELLKHADVGLVLNDPGLVSRMPNKVFSYLSYGLPIISNLEGGELENLLKEKNWGFTCSEELSDFSDALKKLLKGELYFDKNRIYNQAKSIFDKKSIYERYAHYVLEQIK
jgi:glycosyltransferase involved in cell wall biosynthesis